MGIAVILALLLMSPALTKTGGQEGEEVPIGCQLSFDGDIANQSVQFQTDLGPRLPGSAASSELRESIKSNMSGWHITESTHHVNGMVLMLCFARQLLYDSITFDEFILAVVHELEGDMN